MCAIVIRVEFDEHAIYGITNDCPDAKDFSICSRDRLMNKSERIPEAVFVGVGEEELPGLAAVGGFVEAGLVAGAGGHDDGGVGVEALDGAEVEVLGAGWD